MDIAYRCGDLSKLYLNPTNRCTNRCGFCIRYHADGVGDGLLWGGPEPDLEALLAAVEAKRGAEPFREITWCGFGEPTCRLDLITGAAIHLRRVASSLRLNTNGHACLIHGRDVLPELAAAVDDVSVSLNAPTRERYVELCRPDRTEVGPSGNPGASASEAQAEAPKAPPDSAVPAGAAVRLHAPTPGDFWDATLDFLARSVGRFRSVQASVVGAVLKPREITASRELARSLGVERFRVR
jgi:TatD family-associated radical SAM protein